MKPEIVKMSLQLFREASEEMVRQLKNECHLMNVGKRGVAVDNAIKMVEEGLINLNSLGLFSDEKSVNKVRLSVGMAEKYLNEARAIPPDDYDIQGSLLFCAHAHARLADRYVYKLTIQKPE